LAVGTSLERQQSLFSRQFGLASLFQDLGPESSGPLDRWTRP